MSDLHSAIANVGEVATFAWSLIELLLTRILPLLGFIVSNLLLHCFLLVVSVFTPSASAADRRRRLKSPRANELRQRQQQPDEQHQHQGYGDLINPPRSTAAAHVIEDVPNNYELQEEAQPASLQAAIAVPVTPAKEEDNLSHATHDLKQSESDLRPSSLPANAEQSVISADAADQLVHVEDSVPSDADALKEMQTVHQPSDLPMNEQSQSSDVPIVNELDLIASDSRTTDVKHVKGPDVEVSNKSSLGSTKRQLFTQVLPPSLSQIKRTLMQRSRRASHLTSLNPSSPNMKRQSPRVWRLASTMKSSAS